MNEAFSVLESLSQETLLVGFLVFLRVSAAMALLPAFGEQTIPRRIRLVVAIAFTMIVAPVVANDVISIGQTKSVVSLLLATEALAGLLFGIGLRLFVLALQTAGSIAAQATSLSQVFGGGAGIEPLPAMGHMLVYGGLALAVMNGLHVRISEAIILSYEILPPGQFPNGRFVSEWGIGQVSNAFSLAFILAAPFVIASLIYNVALGVINRAMPQLMVAFVGAPAITAGALILMLLVSPALLSVWSASISTFIANPFGGG